MCRVCPPYVHTFADCMCTFFLLTPLTHLLLACLHTWPHLCVLQGKALTTFADLVDNHAYEIRPAELMPCGRTRVRVSVTNNVGGASEWTFIMVLRTFGKYKGCWNTHRLLRSDSQYIDEV